MSKRKGWDAATFTGQGAPEPAAEPAMTATPQAGQRVAIGTYVPAALQAELRILAAHQSAALGRRVQLSDLVTEALTDLLAKYKGRQ